MTKKSFLKIGGAMLLLAIVLNIQYAWSGYGVKDHPLHLEVLSLKAFKSLRLRLDFQMQPAEQANLIH